MRKYLVTLVLDLEEDKPLDERNFDRFILECEEESFKEKMYEYFELNKYSWNDYTKEDYKIIYSIETSDLTNLKVYK